MLIAIDYDDTYTRDPILWQSFMIAIKKSQRHKFIICTARPDEHMDEVYREFSSFIKREDIYNTSHKSKKDYMDDLGVKVDVWIDDDPFSITIGVENYIQSEYLNG